MTTTKEETTGHRIREAGVATHNTVALRTDFQGCRITLIAAIAEYKAYNTDRLALP